MKKLTLLILGGLLAGCVTIHPGLVSPPPVPLAVDQRAAFSSVTVRPPPTITLAWLNGNVGATNIVTGIQSSVDLLNWKTICITNCDRTTNTVTVPVTSQHEFFRAFTDWKAN